MNFQDLPLIFWARPTTKPHKPGMGKRGRPRVWDHPTRPNKEESKARRKMAARSRKINWRK